MKKSDCNGIRGLSAEECKIPFLHRGGVQKFLFCTAEERKNSFFAPRRSAKFLFCTAEECKNSFFAPRRSAKFLFCTGAFLQKRNFCTPPAAETADPPKSVTIRKKSVRLPGGFCKSRYLTEPNDLKNRSAVKRFCKSFDLTEPNGLKNRSTVT